MGGRWPYSCCFVGCCLQDLFKIAHRIISRFINNNFIYLSTIIIINIDQFYWYDINKATTDNVQWDVPIQPFYLIKPKPFED